MKKLRMLLTWGLLLAVTHVMGYTITVEPMEIVAGQSTNLVINLSNTETDLTAYQMFLYLPEGVTVQKKSNGKYAYTANADRHDGAFTYSVKDAADGSVLIAVYSPEKDVITGSSGELIRLPLEVASTVTTSLQGSLRDIEFTDVQMQAHTVSDMNFTMTMEGGDTPPVVITDDVAVSVSDMTITAGSTTDLIINMSTTQTNLTAYQMFLYLPEGVTVQKKSNGKYAYTANASRHDGEFTYSVKDAADGSVLIAVYSPDKDVITGSSGELIRLPLEVASTVTTSLQGSLRDIEFTDVQMQAHTVSDMNFTMTMEGGGDTPPVVITDDVAVSVSDMTITAGGTTDLIINMSTTQTNLTAYQMFLYLPEGVTVQKKSNGKYAYTANADRHDGAFTYSVKDAADGSVLIAVYSPDKDVITGSSGELIRLPLEVAATVTTSLQGSLRDIEFTDVQMQPYNPADLTLNFNLGEPAPPSNIIFADDNVKALCVANWDTNSDGELSEAEAAAVTDLGEVFSSNTTITSFNELQYFTGLTAIGNQAFYGCTALTSVVIPDNVTSIGIQAFYSCTSLANIDIQNAEASIGLYAFNGCADQTLAARDKLISWFAPVAAGSLETTYGDYFKLTRTDTDNKHVIDANSPTFGTATERIRFTHRLKTGGSFNNNNGLTLTFPRAGTLKVFVRTGSNSATNRKLILTQYGSEIYNRVVKQADAIQVDNGDGTTTDIHPVISVAVQAGAVLVSYPTGALNFYGFAFEPTSDEPSPAITFADDNVKALCVANWDTNGDGELSYSEAAMVTDLGGVFKGNTEITSFDELQYFKGLTSIGDFAFQHCSSLTSVTIGNSVTSIESAAFNGCRSLTSVTVKNPVPVSIASDVFTNRANAVLTVPTGSKADYRAADYWKEFRMIVDNWGDLVINGDMEGDDVSCFFRHEDGVDEDHVPATIVDGAGKDGSRGIVVHSTDNPEYSWSNQFFIRLTRSLPAGTIYRVRFDYKASQEATVSTQMHSQPGGYIYWEGIGGQNFTTEWQSYEHADIITADQSPMNQMQTIAFNLSELPSATTYYFDNIVFEIDNDLEGTEDVYTVCGTSDLVGTSYSWELTASKNMTKNAETGLYEYTAENVEVTASSRFEFKVVQNGQVWYPEGAGETNWVITPEYLGGEGYYTITITINPETKEISVSSVKTAGPPYTVVGSFYYDETEITVFGTAWDPTNTEGDMVLGDDGVYTWTKDDVELPAGVLKYKVVKNHSWDVSWGMTDQENGDAVYNVNAAGTYTITVKFNPAGTFENGWNVDCVMVRTDVMSGDANGDGKVDIADVTAIINKINNVPPASFNETAADVNNDGKIDIADVTGVINIINN